MMKRIDKPTWAPDFTAEAPRSNADFLGGYFYYAWCPVIRFQIKKEGDKYLTGGDMLQKTGVWEKTPRIPAYEIEPLSDSLGFVFPSRGKKEARMIYNHDLKRFEMVLQFKGREPDAVRIPLVRKDPLFLPDEGKYVWPNLNIGIPAWN